MHLSRNENFNKNCSALRAPAVTRYECRFGMDLDPEYAGSFRYTQVWLNYCTTKRLHCVVHASIDHPRITTEFVSSPLCRQLPRVRGKLTRSSKRAFGATSVLLGRMVFSSIYRSVGSSLKSTIPHMRHQSHIGVEDTLAPLLFAFAPDSCRGRPRRDAPGAQGPGLYRPVYARYRDTV
eukprot:SAG11_NODE_474_length_9142_cov_6.507907_14_plen_179_part_00